MRETVDGHCAVLSHSNPCTHIVQIRFKEEVWHGKKYELPSLSFGLVGYVKLWWKFAL